MKRISLFIPLMFLFGSVFSTPQEPDLLIYKNDTFPLFYSFALDTYFEQKKSTEIVDFYSGSSTACYREYLAVWEIRNDSIFLNSIRSCDYERYSVEANLSLTFKEKCINNEVFVDWINDTIMTPYGNFLEYSIDRYFALYEFERDFIFEKGILKEVIEYENQVKFSEKYNLNTLIYENINWDLIKANKGSAKEVALSFQTNSLGKPIHIEMRERGSANKIIDEEIIRVISEIPQWTTYFKRGKVTDKKWRVRIKLNKFYYRLRKNKK